MAAPGFLIAERPGPDSGFDPGEQLGDGPPSTDDEGEDGESFVGELNSWSKSGGSRESSFRKQSEEKMARAQKIRSDCLTSHLITPQMKSRSIDESFTQLKVSQGPSTIATTPRKLGEGLGGDVGVASFKARGSSSSRKAAMSNLASLASGR